MPDPFIDIPPTPADHFRLYFYAAVLRVVEIAALACETLEAAFEQFPFLAGYCDEMAPFGLGDLTLGTASGWWQEALAAWEARTATHLPLRALREVAGLDHTGVVILMLAGLIEEDARFGQLFAALQGADQDRPTAGLLGGWWADTAGSDLRATLRRLREHGLVQVLNPEAPRGAWVLQPPALLWDALSGDLRPRLAPWLLYRSSDELFGLDELILPDKLQRTLETLPALLASGALPALVVRGPQQNGRRTLLGALAQATGRGLLLMSGPAGPADERWRVVGPLATALHAMPVVTLDLAPGETAELPALHGYAGPLGVATGRQGGLRGPAVEQALTLTLDLPHAALRREHWRRLLEDGALPAADAPERQSAALDAIADGFRLTSGNIHRAAALARSYAALDGRCGLSPADVRRAGRALNRQALDTLAQHLPAEGDWSQLVAAADTLHALELLERRCRHRERLPTAVGVGFGAGLGPGVRALFSGPSGTGKTLAARLLAAALQKDLYRVDLAAVVDKYIGETEKNLSQLFARAEELDVVLLLDEGDALLTKRTSVKSSNDRYANLETNYLLQRIESYEGILLVTTNAAQRIDEAFQRRMDVVVEFRSPEPAERWAIWQLHLPARHAVHAGMLDEVARRCALNGGQIRNAALYAALLALDDGEVVTADHLEAAVQREYRKLGAVCPLRPASVYGDGWR